MTHSQQVQRIRRINIILLGLMLLVAVAGWDLAVGGGLVLGALLSVLNFELLIGIVGTLGSHQPSPGMFVGRVMGKFLGLMGLSALLLMVFSLNAITFAAGFSVTFLSIGLGGVVQLVSGSPSGSESSDA